ncbi:MAG: preprotein translocase subunit SecE [Caldilineaceae bacterium]
MTTEVRTENALMRYFRETRAELAKVSWPTREEGTRLTVIVFIATVIATIIIFGVDSLFHEVILFLLRATA